MIDERESFGDQLRHLREAAGLTREQLAERAGLTAHGIAALERGRRQRPYPHTVHALADALGLSEGEREMLARALPSRISTPATPAAPSLHSLWVPPTPLIGREHDLTILGGLLNERERLVTLTGPGGVGKTRLAVEAAGNSAGAFTDGIAFVPLSPVADPHLVIPTIAQAIGLREAGAQPLPVLLRAYLRDRQMLLVLDNVEHVMGAAPDVAELIAASPRISVLATSRAPLRLRGEREYPVLPLELPNLTRVPSAGEVARTAAVQLFLHHAHAVLPEFEIDRTNAAAVAAICRRLEGLPLAIELAAARIRLLGPTELLARLDTTLTLLTGGPRDLPERQRTMRGTIQWSYDLLTDREQEVFRRLAVFTGGWTLEAAEAVGVGQEIASDEILGLLADLVEQSLVLVEPGEARRYRLLEPVRQFAQHRLVASGALDATQRAHAAWCLGLAERAEAYMFGAEAPIWLARLAVEHNNFRVALDWALDHGETETGLRLAGALFWTWLTRYPREGRDWLERALATPTDVAPAARAKALFTLGTLAYWVESDYGRSRQLVEEALVLRRQLQDHRGVAETLFQLGHQAWVRGDIDRAETLVNEGEPIATQVAAPDVSAAFMVVRALIAHSHGNSGRAQRLLEDALDVYHHLGFQWSAGWALLHLADLARDQGAAAEAITHYTKAAVLFTAIGSGGAAAAALRLAGETATRRGEFEGAARLLGATEALGEALVVPMQPLNLTAHNSARDLVRTQLGEETFGTVWAEGRDLSLEEAIGEAERLTKELTAPAPAVSRGPEYPAGLTGREVEVLRLVAEGLTNPQVAERLYLSSRTVDAHLQRIYTKLDVSSRGAAIRFAVDHKLV